MIDVSGSMKCHYKKEIEGDLKERKIDSVYNIFEKIIEQNANTRDAKFICSIFGSNKTNDPLDFVGILNDLEGFSE
jgi:hypothetical protein